ncbi:MAG: hypothetical protein VYB45_11330, partial [Pseudomonadota bacterium]|nr:hypothetical protein [Pseudomonadota bacterium]
ATATDLIVASLAPPDDSSDAMTHYTSGKECGASLASAATSSGASANSFFEVGNCRDVRRVHRRL